MEIVQRNESRNRASSVGENFALSPIKKKVATEEESSLLKTVETEPIGSSSKNGEDPFGVVPLN
jgi:hypothetical protein